MKELWVEKYRPSTIDGYVFRDNHQKSQVESWIKQGTIPHLLFSGNAGIGNPAHRGSRHVCKAGNADALRGVHATQQLRVMAGRAQRPSGNPAAKRVPANGDPGGFSAGVQLIPAGR